MDYGKDSVRIGPSPHGLGVFSRHALRVRDWVGPIDGTVMEDPRYESDYCMALGEQMALEPDPPFRFLNHSCRPNCALMEVEVDYGEGESPQLELWLQIQAAVSPGEQLTIDYGWPAVDAIPCSCGAPDCRGWIVAADACGDLPL